MGKHNDQSCVQGYMPPYKDVRASVLSGDQTPWVGPYRRRKTALMVVSSLCKKNLRQFNKKLLGQKR
jgi:hypothetical protein